MIYQGVELCCPQCKGELTQTQQEGPHLQCDECNHSYPILLGIADLRVFPEPYLDTKTDWAKGLDLATQYDKLSFEELVEYYYRTNAKVPAQQAKQYTRGLMAGSARAKAAYASWDCQGDNPKDGQSESLLEIGCGTGPMLVVAAKHYKQVVGVDISFHWLAVAKKRLAEAGLEIPLICACAEALPLKDDRFDAVVSESTLEAVKDQQKALSECYRVMRSGGRLCLSTANKFSLGPDPHVGLLAGGYLPDRWVAAYVRRKGGVPPKRRLLSVRSLAKLIRRSGFDQLWIDLPDVPPEQKMHCGKLLRLAIDTYHLVKRLPVLKNLLFCIGPLFHAVARKPLHQR